MAGTRKLDGYDVTRLDMIKHKAQGVPWPESAPDVAARYRKYGDPLSAGMIPQEIIPLLVQLAALEERVAALESAATEPADASPKDSGKAESSGKKRVA